MKILLVEDDAMVADGLATALRRNKFTVNWAANGQSALAQIHDIEPGIIMLDLGLPDIDGFDLLRQLKATHPTIPVLILTARDALENKVVGLDLGADDYLTKPFELPELLARLRVLERRLDLSGNSILQIGSVVLDCSANTVESNGEALELSRREYMLVKVLMESSRKIHTRESLESKLYRWDEELASNAIDVHIHNLRKKLPKNFIKTVRGIGYTVNNQ